MSIRKQLFVMAFTTIPFSFVSIAEAGNCGRGSSGLSVRIGGGGISQHIGAVQHMVHRPAMSHVHVQQPTYIPPAHVHAPHPIHIQPGPSGSCEQSTGYNVVPTGYPTTSGNSYVSTAPSFPASEGAFAGQPTGQSPQANGPQGTGGFPNAPQQGPAAGTPNLPPNVNGTNLGTQAGIPASNVDSRELTALQLLMSMQSDVGTVSPVSMASAAEAAAAPVATAHPNNIAPRNGHLGHWQVQLANRQTISLNLNGDNTFSWVATKDGKSTSFDGQYRMEAGRLTLVRSNDLQQMAGDWQGQNGNFTFKLDGAANSGMAFVRVQ